MLVSGRSSCGKVEMCFCHETREIRNRSLISYSVEHASAWVHKSSRRISVKFIQSENKIIPFTAFMCFQCHTVQTCVGNVCKIRKTWEQHVNVPSNPCICSYNTSMANTDVTIQEQKADPLKSDDSCIFHLHINKKHNSHITNFTRDETNSNLYDWLFNPLSTKKKSLFMGAEICVCQYFNKIPAKCFIWLFH